MYIALKYKFRNLVISIPVRSGFVHNAALITKAYTKAAILSLCDLITVPVRLQDTLY